MSEQLSSTNTSNSDRYDESSTEKSQDSQNQDRVSGTTVIADEDDGPLTVRALVSTKEAGVIIGKGGKNVAELRESTGVKAGVSKVVPGIHDRVLTVTGSLEGVAKAYAFISRTLLDNPISPATPPTSPTSNHSGKHHNSVTLRLLISHNLMGTVIGRQGAKIKHIQDTSGVRMTASKALLPQSTERIVEVRGTVDGIRTAIQEIGQCLLEDKERAYGTILYNPTKANNAQNNHPTTHRRTSSITRTGNGTDFASNPSSRRQSLSNNPNIRTQHISIPSDMVGCIIGKGGSKISEIRRLSGSKISIAKMPDDVTGERMFTIQGTPEANERALYLLYGQLENEKERRLRGVMQQELEEEEEEEE